MCAFAATLATTALGVTPAEATANPLDPAFAGGRPISTVMDAEIRGLAGPAVLPDGSVAVLWSNRRGVRWSARGREIARVEDVGAGTTDLIRRSDGLLIAAMPRSTLGAAAFTSDLSLHREFGQNGVTAVNVPGARESATHAVAEAPGGAVLVAGGATAAGPEEFAVARFDRQGRPDPTFGGDGVVTTPIPGAGPHPSLVNHALGVAASADGHVVAAGTVWDPAARRTVAAVVRYLPDGSLDSTFGGDGIVTLTFRAGAPAAARAVVLQPVDGETRILLAGHSGPAPTRLYALARLRADGSLDPSFGSGRPTVTSFWGGAGSDMLVAPDGRILVSGDAAMHVPALGLAGYTADGRPDRAFGVGGRICTPIPDKMPEPGEVDETTLALAPGGRVVLGASWGIDRAFLALTRYRPFRVETATCVRVQDRRRRPGAVIRALLGRRARLAIDVAVTSTCGDPSARTRRVGRVRFRSRARGLATFVWNGTIRGPRPPRGGCYRIAPLLLDAGGRVVERFEPGYA